MEREIKETLKLNVSAGALKAISVIEEAGGKADLVGGCVRDGILDRDAKDEDITTNFDPDRICSLFKSKGFRVIPTGIQHGTVTVMIESEGQMVGYEITTYRIDGASADQRHPDSVTFVDDIKKDMERRDLTINAMAYNPSRGLTDFFGGLEDLKNGVIRTVGAASERFKEDALRMMRVVRFSAQLGFTIDEAAKDAIRAHCEDIKNVSHERIHDELIKILKSNSPAQGIRNLHELGLLKQFMPALDDCFDEELGRQVNPWHLYTVGEHTMKALENSPNDLTLRLAVLLHDVAKPIVRSTDENGIDHFYKHPGLSSKMAEEILMDLKFTTKEKEEAAMLIKYHDQRLEPERKKVEKFVLNNPKFTPELFNKLLDLQKSDHLGQNPEMTAEGLVKLEQVRKIFSEVVSGPYRESDLAINGGDIMAITSTAKGEPVTLRAEEIRVAKHMCLAHVLQDSSRNTKEELVMFVRKNAKQIKTTVIQQRNKK